MKRHLFTSILLMSLFSANAQEKKKDTLVVTEVVNVITRYNPKIADVKKIAKNPINSLLEKNNKKKLKYLIYSAPVASTFIPKTGVVKGINIGVKERVYQHYLAAGFGNYKSPYAELFISKSKRFENAFGLHATYNASNENIDKTKLSSTFSNFSTSAFYTQEERYFDWKIQSGIQRNAYNWYGLPQDRTFSETVVNAIDAKQNYTYIELSGDVNFYDSYLKTGNVSMGYFIDRFKSSEVLVNFNFDARFPIPFFKNTLNDIGIKGGLEFLKGSFKNNYQNTNALQYQQNTLKIIPQYSMDYRGLSLKASLRTFVSLDTENKLTNFFVFPEVQLQTDLYKNYIHGTIGFTGNLQTNTYQQFTEENPYVSPTLFITQTAETAHLYIAFNGSLSRELSYHIKVSVKEEEDKPLFLRNISKSGVLENPFNDSTLEGYEYGNSFTIFYDDVQTSSIFAEVEYHYNENLRLSAQVKYNNYTTTNASEDWNLPSSQSSLIANYKAQKWYATVTAFYMSERKDALYNTTSDATAFAVARLNSFIDLNLNGGYHFSDQFSTFLRINNLFNTSYQRFANFDTQGLQISGGITYKFDL